VPCAAPFPTRASVTFKTDALQRDPAVTAEGRVTDNGSSSWMNRAGWTGLERVRRKRTGAGEFGWIPATACDAGPG